MGGKVPSGVRYQSGEMSEDSPKNERTPPWKQDSEREAAGFGLWLRRQREVREIPLREVADVTKISLRYLEALEQDRFDVLPAPVFAKGFLREYARYVGLDADEVVNSFLIANGEIVESSDDAPEEGAEKPEGNRMTVFTVLALLAIVVVVVVVALLRRAQAEQPIPAPTIAAPVQPVEVPEVATTVVAESDADDALAEELPLVVILDFTEDCWVEAVVDDDRTISELRVQGESMRLEARDSVLLTLGNPGGVRVEVNGAPYEFDFSDSRIVRDLAIDLEVARGLVGEDG